MPRLPTISSITFDKSTMQVNGVAKWNAADHPDAIMLRVPLVGMSQPSFTIQSTYQVRAVGPGSGWSIASDGAALRMRVAMPYDLDGDGVVGGADVGMLLNTPGFDGAQLGTLLNSFGDEESVVAAGQNLAIGVTPANPDGPGGGFTTATWFAQPALTGDPSIVVLAEPHELMFRITRSAGVSVTLTAYIML
jgi:hypothetical protein